MTCVLGVIFIQHLDKEVGGKFYRAYILIFSNYMQLPGRHNQLNPINSMRPGEEIEMTECKQFQIKQSVKF